MPETRIVTKRLRDHPEDSWTIERYLATGGYEALRKALGMTTEAIQDEQVKASGLRGRGGAGFGTGQKWSFLPKGVYPRYLAVNADEGEPSTFKDHMLVERDPHQLIEGVVISAFAVECHQAFVYIRGEFALGYERLRRAIDEAYERGYLGRDILGSGFDLDVILHRGAGCYIAGDETGLLSSLEGERAMPRIKPPFPAVQGLFAKPLGTTFRELIEGLAGGVPGGRSIKFFIPGGASSPWLMPEHLDEPTDMDHVQNDLKSMLGSGAIMVFDETTDPLLVAWRLAKFFAHESCGKCTPCREGSGWIEKILYRMSHGLGRPDDLDLMLDFGDNVVPGLNAPFAQTTICALGPSIMSHVVSLDRYFRDEIAERMGADTRTRIPVAAPGGGGR